MSLIYDLYGEDNQESGMGYISDPLGSTVTSGESPYVDERGFAMDTASSLGRGVLGLVGKGAKAFEVLTSKEIGLDEWAARTRENVDFFKPDESEFYGEKGAIGRGWQGAMESLPASIGGALPGAAAGAAIGSAFGGIGAAPGAVIGGLLSTLGLFGAGTYGEAKERALENGLSENDAHMYALKHAAIEGGIETAASGVELLTSGLGKFFTKPLTQSLKQILKVPAKDIAKAYGKTMATEVSTEMLQSGLGAGTDIQYGMGGDTTVLESMAESILPAVFMSGIFTTGSQAYNAKKRAQMHKDLTSNDSALQMRAVNALYENIRKEDPELADGFKSYAVANLGTPFDINVNLVDMMTEVRENETKGDINPLDSDVDALGRRINHALIPAVEYPYEDLSDDGLVQAYEDQSLRYRRDAAGYGVPALDYAEKNYMPALDQMTAKEVKEQEEAAIRDRQKPGPTFPKERPGYKPKEKVSTPTEREDLPTITAARFNAFAEKVKREKLRQQQEEVRARQEREGEQRIEETKGLGAPPLEDEYQLLEAEEKNILKRQEEAKAQEEEVKKTVDELVTGGNIFPEERELLEDAYMRTKDGVELTPNQELLMSRISTGIKTTETEGGAPIQPDILKEPTVQEKPKEALESDSKTYVSPEGTQTPIELESPEMGQIDVLRDTGETAFTKDNKTVRTVVSPEEAIAADEQAAIDRIEDEARLRPSETWTELTPESETVLTKDPEAFKALVKKTQEEQDLTQAKASWFLLKNAEKEAAQAGREWELTNEEAQALHDAATYKSSSRKKSKAKAQSDLIWDEDTEGGLSTATDNEGRNYIVDLTSKTLTYQAKDGTWKTVSGKNEANLMMRANAVAQGKEWKGTAEIPAEGGLLGEQKEVKLTDKEIEEKKAARAEELETDLTQTELTLEGIDDEGELILGDQTWEGFTPGPEEIKTWNERFQKGERVTDGATLLQEMYDQPKGTLAKSIGAGMNFLRAVVPAEKLKNIQVKPMRMAPVNMQKEKGSMYTRGDNTFYYDETASDRTIIHELVHGVTVNEMKQLGENHPLVKRVQSLSDTYKEFLEGTELSDRQSYAFESVYEFLSMAMSEPEIQADLRAIPVAKGQRTSKIETMWDKFVDVIRRAFNLPKEYTSMLEEVIGVTTDLSNVPLAKKMVHSNPIVAEYLEYGFTLEAAVAEAKKMGAFGDFLPKNKEAIAKTQAWFDKIEKEEKEGKHWWSKPFENGMDTLDKYIQPISDTVNKISPKIHSLLMDMEARIKTRNRKYNEGIEGFVNKYKALDEDKKKILDNYILNSNNPKEAEVLQDMLREYGITKEWNEVQKVLGDIWKGYDDAGLNVFQRIDKYYPRKVKDIKGLMAYLRKTKAKQGGIEVEGRQGIFDDILEDTKLTEKEKEDRIASIINSGYNPATALKVPGSTKSRSIAKVNPAMQQFYHSPVDALIDTIYEATEAIETRRFVGVDARKRLTSQVNRDFKRLQKMEEGTPKYIELQNKIEANKQQILDIEEVSEASVSALINQEGKDISPEEHDQLVQVLRARLNQKGMHGHWATVRDVGLITALGSPLNAVTQAGDIVWSIYENGGVNTMKALFGPKEITTKDLDMSHVLKEFSKGSSAKWVDKVLKATGLDFMDRFLKNVNMQATINKARSTSKDGFVSKWSEALTPETAGKVWEDIQSGEMSEDVKHFVFRSVAKFQPVSLSEMPQMYLQSGNGRIAYTLKSYGIKTLANIRREVFSEYKKGNKAQASKNLMTLVPLLVLANASVDELKDWIMGRDDAFSDQVYENIWKLGFASRYTIDKGISSGKPLETFFKDLLMPPALAGPDAFLKDLTNMLNSEKEMSYSALKMLPVAGKLLYSRTPEGKTKESDRQRSVLYQDIRDSISDGNYGDVRKRINAYNRKQRKSGGEIIDNQKIRTIKSKERKRLRGIE